jgi:hypothetical protein
MIADMREALEAVLGPISEPVLLPGGCVEGGLGGRRRRRADCSCAARAAA